MSLSGRTMKWFVVAPLIVGAWLAYNKHLLLKVPKIGFILHSIAGGPVPPYIDHTIFQRHKEWLKPGSIVISTPAKSGTTWTMYTLHLIRTQGNPPSFIDQYQEVPWVEFTYYPGQSIAERIEILRNASTKYPINVIKTHGAPPTMPFRDDVKYVVIIRNPYDVAASGREFFSNHGKQFAKMWGGFPPGAEEAPMSEKEWEDFFLSDMGGGKPFGEAFVLDVFRSWWPYRNHPNVLFVHYADRLLNDPDQVRRMAEFVGVPLDPAQIQDISHKGSFGEMKKLSDKMEMVHTLNAFKMKSLVPEDVFIFRRDNGGSLIQKGAKRDGATESSAGVKTALHKMLTRMFGPKTLEWFLHGGPLPLDEDLLPSA